MRSVAETVLSQAEGSFPLGDTRARKWSDSMRMFVSESLSHVVTKTCFGKTPRGPRGRPGNV